MHRVTPLLIAIAAIALAGCAAGDPRFTPDDPAGFWAGLWHGLISLITLIIGLFTDEVGFFEPNNRGWGYEVGFWLGIVIMAGGAHRGASQPRKRARDKEWEAIGKKVEAKLKRMIREWAEAEPDEDWKVVEAKAEAKLKRELRRWADEP
ncbi:MAG: hypothetical protein HC927_04675 [Deltaproteobacteria bacterium]|nr:hypothetical protein [Deltaproteobacteria bacterium]